MTEQQIERRKHIRRQIEPVCDVEPDDRRRAIDRRGRTVEDVPPVLTREQQVYGERRQNKR